MDKNKEYINPRNNAWLLSYLKAIGKWHGNIEFLDTGIDENMNTASMVPSDKLFITPKFSNEYIDATAKNDELEKDVFELEEVFTNYKSVFIKGDPGSGKSTLVNRISYLFTKTMDNALNRKYGFLIPFPIVLREINFSKLDGSFENFIEQYFRHIKFTGLSENISTVINLFENGQAFFLFDGLDEIVIEDQRKLLSGILSKGIDKYTECRWWFTTRLIGFDQREFWGCSISNPDEKSFHLDQDLKFLKVPHHGSNLRKDKLFDDSISEHDDKYVDEKKYKEIYIAPFDNRQIEKFASLWYNIREKRSELIESETNEFFSAVMQNVSIQHLARIPLFITMIALHFEVNKSFPDGRVALYKSIVKAYLKDINAKRKIPLDRQLSFDEQYKCMGKLALKLQEIRSESGKSAHQLSIQQEEAEDIFVKAIMEMGINKDEKIEKNRVSIFFRSLKTNSEVLIPKTENTFSFLHLSYQEFFAAEELRDEFEDILIDEQETQEAYWEKMNKIAHKESWAETIILFFEGFRTEERNYTKKCKLGFEKIFKWNLQKNSFEDTNIPLVTAKILINNYIGDNFSYKNKALDRLLIGYIDDTYSDVYKYLFNWGLKSGVLFHADSDNTQTDNLRWIIGLPENDVLEQFANATIVNINYTTIVDLNPLKNLKQLEYLYLNQTQVSDLSPLSDLTNLRMLYLNQTQVSDLSPLSDLTNLRMLYLNQTQVSDLSPLKALKQLEYLYLNQTQVSDLSPLSDLTNLRWLYLNQTQVSDLSPLKALKQLEYLNLNQTQVSDLSPLSDLTNLRWLYLNQTQVSDLSPLKALKQLEYLYLNQTQVSDLSPLKALKQLEYLYLNETQVSDLSPLVELKQLYRLYLNQTQVSDLSPLSDLTNLRSLNLNQTQVSDLSPLSDLTNLRSLNLNQTQVSDLSPLKALKQLEYLYLNQTQVSDLSPLSDLTNLRWLYLNQTQVSDLSPLSDLTNLGDLDLNQTQVSDLSPLSDLTNLGDLYLNQTQVSDLSPLKALKQLEYLYLNQTQVSDLSPLSDLTNLISLNLNQTQVSDLSPLVELKQLYRLDLNQTQVSDLSPLSDLTNLRWLYLNQTQVSDLSPLKALKQLEYLDLNQTQVSDLSPLSDLTNLGDLDLNQTQVSDLSPLSDLTNLRMLYLNQTQVSDLSPLKNIKDLEIIIEDHKK